MASKRPRKPKRRPEPGEVDAFGLTGDDWMSLCDGNPEVYSPTARLWWALAGVPNDYGPTAKTGLALGDYLRALGADVRGLVAAARSSHDAEMSAIAATLENLGRRLDLAAEIAQETDELRPEQDDFGAADPYPARSATVGVVIRK